MWVPVRSFLTKVEEIANEGPEYQQGHDGSDGYCDCIGLIIGAIRRGGGNWRGTHGSNYARRSEMATFGKVEKPGDLVPGEIVYKANEPSDPHYDLPDKYKPGHNGYMGDIRDYYHVGVVISVNPLRIRHMTTPTSKLDDKIGRWKYHGQLAKVKYDYDESKREADSMTGEVQPMYQARVEGGRLNIRNGESVSSAKLGQVPEGAILTVVQDRGDWCWIEYNGIRGYVKSSFLIRMDVSEDSQTITVDRMRLEAVYDELGDLLGLRG